MKRFDLKQLQKRKEHYLLSPSLLTLVACGGGGGGNTSTTPAVPTYSGAVVKGPVQNALVFIDENGDGEYNPGEQSRRTDSLGNYQFLDIPLTGPVIAITDDSSIDNSTGLVVSGMKLVAPAGSQVISPFTTLMVEGGMSQAQIKSALNLPNVDLTTFNPFGAGVDPSNALRVEIAAHQLSNVVKTISSALTGNKAGVLGFEEAAAVAAKTVAEAIASSDNVSLVDEAFVTSLILNASSNLTIEQATALGEIATESAKAVVNLNNVISGVADLSSNASKKAFGLSNQLTTEVNLAAQAGGSVDDITLANPGTASSLVGENNPNTASDYTDKTLIVVIDGFSNRVLDYDNVTLYDYGYQTVEREVDTYTDPYTGAISGYGNLDYLQTLVPDPFGNFYEVTPDGDNTYLIDPDYLGEGTFIDEFGDTAYYVDSLVTTRIQQGSELNVNHGDWVVEAICQTLDDVNKTEILCIDTDQLSWQGDWGKVFSDTYYYLEGERYFGTYLESIIADFIQQNDVRFTGEARGEVYSLAGISMSIAGSPAPPYGASGFLADLSAYKIPFFQSAPNVNNGTYDWSTFFPDVISVGAWNVDNQGYILAASETALPTVDLLANGYIERPGWDLGWNFGTSFATPTAAAEFANVMNAWIADLNASGVSVADIPPDTVDLSLIDYTDLTSSVIQAITSERIVDLNIYGNVQPYTVDVLNDTLETKGEIPVVVPTSGGIYGVTVAGVALPETENVNLNLNDTNGPSFSDFSILDNTTTDGLSGDYVTVKFKMSDPNGIDEHPLNIFIKNGDRGITMDFSPRDYVYLSDGFIQATSQPIDLTNLHPAGAYEILSMSVRDNMNNWTGFDRFSDFIANLSDNNKTIIVMHEPGANLEGPQFSDFSILDNIIVPGENSGDYVTVKFKMSDPDGISDHAINVRVQNELGSYMLDFDPRDFVFLDNGYIQAVSQPIYDYETSGEFEITLIQMRDDLGNWTAFEPGSSFLTDLTQYDKTIIVEDIGLI